MGDHLGDGGEEVLDQILRMIRYWGCGFLLSWLSRILAQIRQRRDVYESRKIRPQLRKEFRGESLCQEAGVDQCTKIWTSWQNMTWHFCQTWAWALVGARGQSGAGCVLLCVSCYLTFLCPTAIFLSRLKKNTRTEDWRKKACLGFSKMGSWGQELGLEEKNVLDKNGLEGTDCCSLPPQGMFRVTANFSPRLIQTLCPWAPWAASSVCKQPQSSHFKAMPLE